MLYSIYFFRLVEGLGEKILKIGVRNCLIWTLLKIPQTLLSLWTLILNIYCSSSPIGPNFHGGGIRLLTLAGGLCDDRRDLICHFLTFFLIFDLEWPWIEREINFLQGKELLSKILISSVKMGLRLKKKTYVANWVIKLPIKSILRPFVVLETTSQRWS